MCKKLTSNHLKIIAISAMFLDHFVAVFISHNTDIGILLRIPGRIVAPLICFMIAEGYHKTSNVNKYLGRLFIFALISHLPFNITFGYKFFQATSVMWGLFFGLLALEIIKTKNLPPILKLGALGICCLLSITADWNYVVVLWIVGFGIFYGNFKKQVLAFCIIAVFAHFIPTFFNFGFSHNGYPHWYQLGVLLAIPLISLYSGKRGKDTLKLVKYGFYAFYPAHLLFLHLLNIFTPLKEILSEVIK